MAIIVPTVLHIRQDTRTADPSKWMFQITQSLDGIVTTVWTELGNLIPEHDAQAPMASSLKQNAVKISQYLAEAQKGKLVLERKVRDNKAYAIVADLFLKVIYYLPFQEDDYFKVKWGGPPGRSGETWESLADLTRTPAGIRMLVKFLNKQFNCRKKLALKTVEGQQGTWKVIDWPLQPTGN